MMKNDVKLVISQLYAHKMRRDNGNESNESDDINEYYAQINRDKLLLYKYTALILLSVGDVDLR